MKVTRRDFIKFGGIAAAVFGASESIYAANDNGVLATQAESFHKLIGTEFYIWRKDFSVSGTLIKVEHFPNQPLKGECYSLIFELPIKRAAQETYNISHPNLGNFQLFLTEGRNGENCVLTATINRL